MFRRSLPLVPEGSETQEVAAELSRRLRAKKMASEQDKQTAFAVVEWLHESLDKVSADDREGLETAIQLVEEAFSVNAQDEGQKGKLSLKPATLSQVLQVYKRTKSSAASPSTSTAPQGEASGHANARDKAAAEDLKSQGNSEMAAKNFDRAIELYGQAIDKDSQNPVYFSNRSIFILYSCQAKLINHYAPGLPPTPRPASTKMPSGMRRRPPRSTLPFPKHTRKPTNTKGLTF